MAQKKKGFMARMLEGKERSEDYARNSLPTSRWSLFWDIFKGNLGKLCKINLLTAIFFIPLFMVIIMSSMALGSMGQTYPFGANLGIGYPAQPDLIGLPEWMVLQNHFYLYLGIIVSMFIASIGLAGGMYVIRNMIWTEGVFVGSDFWRGVKRNYKNALQATLFFSIIFTGTMLTIDNVQYALSVGGASWISVFRVLAYILLIFGAMMTLWMIAMGVNYNIGFFAMLKNSTIFALSMLPQSLFFGGLAILPFLLLRSSGILLMIGIFLTLTMSFSFALLVWLNFGQWTFDKFINPRIEGAKVNRGIYKKEEKKDGTQDTSLAEQEYKRQILAYGKSRLIARPVKPIDDDLEVYSLPSSFTREDLQRLRESKEAIVNDSEAYVAEHENDERYVEYNRIFEERERALQDSDLPKKQRKKKPPKLLG